MMKIKKFLIIDDVISFFASEIFPDHDLDKKMLFRVIRDSDVEIQEEAEDLVRSFELALKRRRTGDIVRLEILKNSNNDLIKFITNKLNVKSEYIYEIEISYSPGTNFYIVLISTSMMFVGLFTHIAPMIAMEQITWTEAVKRNWQVFAVIFLIVFLWRLNVLMTSL